MEEKKQINTREDLLEQNDAVVYTKDLKRLWYRGKVGDELRFTQPIEGSFMHGRTITDVYCSLAQVTVVAPNTVVIEGKTREDKYTDSVVENPHFMKFMHTRTALAVRGLA